jgi:hypothetical protein
MESEDVPPWDMPWLFGAGAVLRGLPCEAGGIGVADGGVAPAWPGAGMGVGPDGWVWPGIWPWLCCAIANGAASMPAATREVINNFVFIVISSQMERQAARARAAPKSA